MVAVTPIFSSFIRPIPCPHCKHLPSSTASNLSSPSLPNLRRIRHSPRKHNTLKTPNPNGPLFIRCYMENKNPISGFANQVIGSLPLIGLFARIFSDEGGVGGDLIDFAEFRRRVGNKCSMDESRAFYDFRDRRGPAGDPIHVLLCCWVATIGAGLLKSEEVLEGAARLRISNDIEFEEQNFMALMNEAKERRAKLKVDSPAIPMEVRVEKALEAIYICCFGKDPIEAEDERLLCAMLVAVFPSVKQQEVERIVKDKKSKVKEGNDEGSSLETKPLSKEAVKKQMKDLQFLKQNRGT